MKVFKDKEPLENRKSAFEEFDEYVSFIEKVSRLKKDDKGNLWIDQPMFINEILNQDIKSDISAFLETLKLYKEEITILLVITDDEINRKITQPLDFENELQREFPIHKITSSPFDFEPQDLIDNLDMVEVPIFNHFKINIEYLVETVFHYGLDFADSGEDEESGAKRIILPTPFIWDSYQDYYG